MDVIATGFVEAIKLIFSGDREIYEILSLSLVVSSISVCISALIGVPTGVLIGTHDFRGKRIIVRIIYTLMSLPPVIAGLVVFLFLMRRGPLGALQLNYTPTAMVIAQILLVAPIIIGLTYNVVKEKASTVDKLGITLGANRGERLKLLIFEMRAGIIAAVVGGFGRAISEVGAVMIVGGNIKGHTRVMTTYITELKGMGNFDRAIAVGIILLAISFIVNAVLFNLQERASK